MLATLRAAPGRACSSIGGRCSTTAFSTGQVIFNVFIDNGFLLVVAVGMTFVILTGGIDLSVGSVVALSGDDRGDAAADAAGRRRW